MSAQHLQDHVLILAAQAVVPICGDALQASAKAIASSVAEASNDNAKAKASADAEALSSAIASALASVHGSASSDGGYASYNVNDIKVVVKKVQPPLVHDCFHTPSGTQHTYVWQLREQG